MGSFTWSNEIKSSEKIKVVVSNQKDTHADLSGSDNESWNLSYTSGDDNDSIFEAEYSSTEQITFDNTLTEDLRGNFGFRFLPNTVLFSKVKNKPIFFTSVLRDSVLYETKDTNNDGTRDAINLEKKLGDEQETELYAIFKTASNVDDSDINGDYGRVFFDVDLDQNGRIEIETGLNKIIFSGDGLVASTTEYRDQVTRDGRGNHTFTQDTAPSGSDIPFDINNNNTIIADGEFHTGAVSKGFEFITLFGVDGEDSKEGSVGHTFLLKLPTNTPSLNGKRYRVLAIAIGAAGDSLFTTSSTSTDEAVFDTNGVTLNIDAIETTKDNLQSQQQTEQISETVSANTVNIASNGATDFEIVNGDTTIKFEGYFNAAASLGAFRTLTTTKIDENSNLYQLGIAFMVQK